MTMPAGYDLWKTRSPEDERGPREFECERCEDEGCIECCPPQPVELEDLDEIDAQIAATDLPVATEITLSPTLAAWDRRRAMERENPMLAFVYFVEAALSGKTENDVCGLSRDADILERSREVLKRMTGDSVNRLYGKV